MVMCGRLGVAIVIAVGLWVAVEMGSAIAQVLRTATMDVETTTSDLLGECGRNREAVPTGEPYAAECPENIRKYVGVNAARTNGAARMMRQGRGKVCADELLEMADEKLVETFSGWAAREMRSFRDAMPVEAMTGTVLPRRYPCPPPAAEDG